MRLLVTGANGQLGKMLLREAPIEGYEVVAAARLPPTGGIPLDITDTAAVDAAVAQVQPDWIVNAAAMTDVDGCERDAAAAHLHNAIGPQNLARAAVRHAARLVHVSTDYVFDGARPGGRYREGDVTNPLSQYGRSKLEGERLAATALPSTIIARTAVVFGPHKKTFVTWVRDELAAGKRVNIVSDQWVSPTHTLDLAGQILSLIHDAASGLYHTAGADRLSRLEMAKAVADRFGLDFGLVDPVPAASLNWLAKRPRDSSLDVSKISRVRKPMPFAQTLEHLSP